MYRALIFFICTISFKAEAQSSALSVADSLYELGNYSKAITIYKQYPKTSATQEKIAKAYQAIGNLDKALLYYKNAVDLDSSNVLLQYNYGKILYKTKAYENAKIIFASLTEKDSENPNFYYELGLVKEKLPDTIISAQEQFLKVFKLDNSHQKAIYKIAKHHLQKRQFELVDQYVDTGLQSYPNNTQLISLKAQNYYWQELYDDAAVWFKKLVDLGESSQFIHEKLSYCYVRLYDNKNALIHCKKALKYQPMNPTNLYILAQIYEQEDDFKNAEKYYKMSIEIQDVPLDKEFRQLAIVLNQQKKYDEAIQTLKKAIKEDPENIQNRFFMMTTKSAYYKDVNEKIKLHEDFIKKYPNTPFTKHAEFLLSRLKNEAFMKRD